MRDQFPKIGEILVSERDQYLAAKIKDAPGQKIVAVLGAHMSPVLKRKSIKPRTSRVFPSFRPKAGGPGWPAGSFPPH
jgi:pheromone shutdown protein TraB